MPRRILPLSPAQLAEAKRLYLEEMLSTYRAAARLKVSQEQVRVELVRAGVTLRYGSAAQTAARAAVQQGVDQ